MRNQITNCFIIFLLALSSCNENIPPPIAQDCPTYPQSYLFSLTNVERRDFDYYNPAFNPNNPFEFAYIKVDYSAIDYPQLRKRNILTGSDQFITTVQHISHNISWSKTDWILYTQDFYTIWKIKSNGSNKTQVISNGDNAYWKPSGEAFLYSYNNNVFVADPDGLILDTLPINTSAESWSSNNRILFNTQTTGSVMAYYDIETHNVTSLPAVTGSGWGYQWLPDGKHFVINYGFNLWLVNSETQEIKLIKDMCGDRYKYYHFSVSPNGAAVLAERVEVNRLDTITDLYEFKDDIVLINIETSHEKVIELWH